MMQMSENVTLNAALESGMMSQMGAGMKWCERNTYVDFTYKLWSNCEYLTGGVQG